MDETNSLIEQRRTKLAALRAKGIDPFESIPTETCDGAREKYKRGEYNDTTEVSVAGRITAHREMGKSMFIDLRDQSGRLQIYAQKNHLEESAPGNWDMSRTWTSVISSGRGGKCSRPGWVRSPSSWIPSWCLPRRCVRRRKNGMAWPTQRSAIASGILDLMGEPGGEGHFSQAREARSSARSGIF